jgi:hypothetical protein
LGEGSEKVLYFLGNNKNALNELKSSLVDDKSGMRLAIYLGQQKERLTTPRKKMSRAPAPGTVLKGDGGGGLKASAAKKKYDAAHKSGKSQDAYTLKKQARAAGIDVSKW